MKISGAATLHAPAGQVWTALSDPNVLVATIPGCERLEPAGPDSYRFTVGAAVASVQGIYTGEVSLSQRLIRADSERCRRTRRHQRQRAGQAGRHRRRQHRAEL